MGSETSKEHRWVIVRPWELKGELVPKPYERVLKILLSPENTGSNTLTFMFSILTPGSRLPWHDHENNETMYIASGRGYGRIENEHFTVEPDMVIYVTPHVKHDIVNTSDETMKIICVHIPPTPKEYIENMIRLAQRDAMESEASKA
jgi:mannose-6-phosphate isomerase-like protein (cupin superfamily)